MSYLNDDDSNQLDIKFAGLLDRIYATIIDIIIFAFPVYLIIKMIEAFTNFNYGIYLLIFLFCGYSIIFTANSGTIGDIILGLKIVNYNYESIGYKKSIIRFILMIISFLLLGSGFINILFSEKSQAIHDSITKVYIINYSS